MVSAVSQERKRRLIVLLPDCLAGNMELVRKVYWIAIRDQCEVFYLALVDDKDELLTTARYMATMKAVTAGNSLVVQSKITLKSAWLSALYEIYQPGDRIVCHAEQVVKTGFLKTVPATDFLRNTLQAPLITISGFYHPQKVQMQHWFHSLVAWFGFLVILAIFTAFEIQLNPLMSIAAGKILFGLILFVEIMVIWTWDTYIGH